jgi:hypothetical protein
VRPEDCNEVGDRPAPKAPNSNDRWYFCEAHAAEYNKNWNYFAGLSPRKPPARCEKNPALRPFASPLNGNGQGLATGRAAVTKCGRSMFWSSTRCRVQGRESAYRRLAKEHHPDTNAGNKEAADKFQKVQAAYEVLRRAKSARTARPPSCCSA